MPHIGWEIGARVLQSLALGAMIRLAKFLGFNYLSVYAPGDDVLAIHLARDGVTLARSMDEYLNSQSDE